MTEKTYNGWTNWETWNFNLHWAYAFTEDADRAYEEAEANSTFTREEQATIDLAHMIESMVEDSMDTPDRERNPWEQDIINGYMREINYHEVARHYIDEVEKEQAA